MRSAGKVPIINGIRVRGGKRPNEHQVTSPRLTINEIRPRPAMEPLIAAVLRVRVGFPFNRSKAIRQRMLGLVKHDVVRARYGHHDHESVPVILNFAVELRSFALQFSDRV
jgi:hypothetical protein